MTDFQIDQEIDKLVDKFADDLKNRLKKLVIRSEKLVLKQYMAAQKETSKSTRAMTASPRERPSSRQDYRGGGGRGMSQMSNRRPTNEREYAYASGSESEDSS
tara:strand:+ start:467 stop:775 length:309 start_codon:yes stop_codon:yes gene_type:complete